MNPLNNSPKESLQLFQAKNKRRNALKYNLKIDMTPMVDLGFLLISFFVITAELTKPTTMNVAVPAEGKPTQLGESVALTVLLGKDNIIFYYEGKWQDAKLNNTIKTTGFSANGLRKIIAARQKKLDAMPNIKEGRNEMMLLIKPSASASYKNVVDVLDEATIGIVKKYAIVKISPDEKDWLEKNQH